MTEIEELLDTLENVISQACGACGPGGQGNLDSMALSAYAEGIRVLAAHGRVRIIEEVGRRVIAEWVTHCQDRHASGFLCDLEIGHPGPHRTGPVAVDDLAPQRHAYPPPVIPHDVPSPTCPHRRTRPSQTTPHDSPAHPCPPRPTPRKEPA